MQLTKMNLFPTQKFSDLFLHLTFLTQPSNRQLGSFSKKMIRTPKLTMIPAPRILTAILIDLDLVTHQAFLQTMTKYFLPGCLKQLFVTPFQKRRPKTTSMQSQIQGEMALLTKMMKYYRPNSLKQYLNSILPQTTENTKRMCYRLLFFWMSLPRMSGHFALGYLKQLMWI